jgi:putative SOS response-associated peptidase YedK
MCGRYSLTTPVEGLRQLFDFPERPNLAPRYNIAPTQSVASVRRAPPPGAAGEPEIEPARGAHRQHLVLLRWGLIPHWAKDASIGSRMINARAETLAEKPSFRAAFHKRRCLIVADGFYEWQKQDKGPKQPYRIARRDGGPFAFAGLWERWRDPAAGSLVESCTIVTTEANALLRPIHDRMPVILPPPAFAAWLDPETGPDATLALLRPYGGDDLVAYRISLRVNSVAHDDDAIITPLDDLADLSDTSEDQDVKSRQPRLL